MWQDLWIPWRQNVWRVWWPVQIKVLIWIFISKYRRWNFAKIRRMDKIVLRDQLPKFGIELQRYGGNCPPFVRKWRRFWTYFITFVTRKFLPHSVVAKSILWRTSRSNTWVCSLNILTMLLTFLWMENLALSRRRLWRSVSLSVWLFCSLIEVYRSIRVSFWITYQGRWIVWMLTWDFFKINE